MARQVGVRQEDGARLFDDKSMRDYDVNTARGLFAFGCPVPEKLKVDCICGVCRDSIASGAERWFDNKLPRQYRKPVCTSCKNQSKEHKLKTYKEADKDGFSPEYWQNMTASHLQALKEYRVWADGLNEQLLLSTTTQEEEDNDNGHN